MTESRTPSDLEPETRDERRLQQLLDRWEAAQEAGVRLTVEELCREDVTLQEAVRRKIAQLETFDVFLDGQPVTALPERIDQYQVVRELARGGTAVVYLCGQEFPKRQVAVKLLYPGRAQGRAFRRFRLEVDVLAALDHPNIASIYAAGTINLGMGLQPFIVMEFIEGRSLRELCRDSSLEVTERIALLLQVCEAVDCAHQNGVIHRDLKPANVMVDRAGRVKVLDFGIAQLTEPDDLRDADTTQPMLGTPPYMSPEQFADVPSRIDARSDVYSLGVVLFELLTGRLPYDVRGMSVLETARVVQQAAPARLRATHPDLPRDLEILLGKALEKDRRQRYQTVAEFAEDLRRVRDGVPILARPVGRMEQAWRWVCRHPWPAGLTAAVMVLLVAAGIVAVLSAHAAQRRSEELERTVLRLEDERRRAAHHAAVAERRSEELGNAQTRLRASVDRQRRLIANATLMRIGTLSDADARQARELLADASIFGPEERGWAWTLLQKRSQRVVHERRVHGSPIQSLAFSGNGEFVATLGSSYVQLWRTDDLSHVCAFAEGLGSGGRVILDQTGRRVIVQKPNGRVLLYDRQAAPERQKTQCWDPHARQARATAMTLSPDETQLAIGDERGRVLVLELQSGRVVSEFPPLSATVLCLRFDKTGARLGIVTLAGELCIGRCAANEIVLRQEFPHHRLVTASWGPQLRFVVGARRFGDLTRWDCQTQTELELGSAGSHPQSVILGGAENALLAARRRILECWHDGERVSLIQNVDAEVLSIAVDSEQKLAALGTQAGELVLVRLQPPVLGRQFQTGQDEVRQLLFAHGGRTLISSGDTGEVFVHDLESGQLRHRFGQHALPMTGLALTPDHSAVLTNDRVHGCRLWDLATGDLRRHFEHPGQRARRLVVSRDGQRVISGGGRGCLIEYSLETAGPPRCLDAHASSVFALATCSQHRWLASGDSSGQIILWNMSDMTRVTDCHSGAGRTYQVAFAPDDAELALIDGNGAIRILEVPSLDPATTFRLHAGRTTCLAFSPDGRLLASGGQDGEIVLWDRFTWEPRLKISSGMPGVHALQFSDDGRLAIAGLSGVIALWEPELPAALRIR